MQTAPAGHNRRGRPPKKAKGAMSGAEENAHTAEEIVERTRDRFTCTAEDCVLFMWATVPYLAVAIDIMRQRGFRYVSNYVWGKDRIITGHWNRNSTRFF